MAILSRKLLPLHKIVVRVEVNPYTCGYVDCNSLPASPLPPPPPPPPPLPRVEAPISNPHSSISPLLVGMFCVLAFVSSVVCYLTLSRRYRSYLRNSLRRNPGHMDENETHQEFIDEDRGPEVFYPIWLINYVGLEQSVIDSIDVVKYKKSENLIEGTDCSVCLTEFEDDENLRLLPKCSHAFHLPCIDTWLRSHKTCPLCRAPIVNETNNAQVSSEVSNPNETSSREEETPTENNEHRDDQVRENEPNELQNLEILEKNSQRISGLRVKSDLGDHVAKMGEELQPMRRSISMDLSSASLIYSTFSNVSIAENEGCSMNTKLERGEKVNLEKTEKGHKRSSSSIYKRAMTSSSFGLSSQKRPLFIKRSYSSSGKSSESSSNSRS